MGAFDKFKKKPQDASGEDEGMDILTEVKEPFSFSGFFETHVMERIRRARDIMAEKGVLFFLFSPFQARSRLIAELLVLVIGVAFGVVPRASSMIGALQDQAYASEIAGLTQKTVGGLTIIPAASSNYKKMHMVAFVLDGKNLPSDASKYDVHLARSYGASDWADVTYSWTIYPIADSRRILLVSIDQSKQASGYGAFDLYVQLAGEEVADYAKTPFEITLSTAQPTTSLYDKTGIHLSALTGAVCGSGEIAKKQTEFEDALSKYQVAVEQAEAMPVDIHVDPTRDDLEAFCLANRVYRGLDDDSTTEDILSMETVTQAPDIEYHVVITSDGIKYDRSYIEELKTGSYSDEDSIRFDAFETVDTAAKAVASAMENVNSEAISWFSTLTSYKLILNQTIQESGFPLSARCTNTIEDEIAFFDRDIQPSDDKEPGLSGTVTDDDPAPAPIVPVDDEPEDPPVTEDPEEDPATEDPEEEDPKEEDPEEEQPEEKPEEDPVDEQPEEKPEEDPAEEQPADEAPAKIETQTGTSAGEMPVSGDPADSK